MKQKIETAHIRVSIITSGSEEAGREAVSTLMQMLLGNSYMNGKIDYMERDGADVELRFKIEAAAYNDNGEPIYEDEAEPKKFGDISREPTPAWGGAKVADAAAETKKEDKCGCDICQIRRALTVGIDVAKPGEDSGVLRVYRFTPGGITPL